MSDIETNLVTEAPSRYDGQDQMSTKSLLENMNNEDITVPQVIKKILPDIEAFIETLVPKIKNGGRLFYIGAGTSGRLGILDASECPPTYGVPDDVVIGLIAGGDGAIRKAVENAEDDETAAWKDLCEFNIGEKDVVVGIAASGGTPYVVGGITRARKEGLVTGGITCNNGSPLAEIAEYPMVAVVGPEFVTGSTRMKAGTAQKLILNMISTALMIRLGRVKGNKMVDMQLSNNKLVKRGTKMLMEEFNIPEEEAKALLLKHGSVRKAILEIHAEEKEA